MAKNLKIIYDNIIDSATLAVSSGGTAGTLVITNTQTDRKSKVYRSTATTVTITCTWGSSKFLDGFAIPFCNLSSQATISATMGGVTKSGVKAAENIPIGGWEWGSTPLGVNAYSYGYNTYGRFFFDSTVQGTLLTITISDPDNTNGFIEIGRLVGGRTWSPTYNTSYGLPISFADTSTHERTESGDMLTIIGSRYKKLTFDLNWLTASDRANFNVIMRNNGLTKAIYVNLFPEDEDTEKEQTYQIYGKMPQISQLTHPMYTVFSAQLDIEEI